MAIVTPFASGDAYAGAVSRCVTLADAWLGTGSTAGVATWGDYHTLINPLLTGIGAPTISDGQLGSAWVTSMNLLNAALDTPTVAEARTLYTRFTTPPTGQRKNLINNLIVSLKTAGVWAKLDALYLTAAADSQAARQNWVANQFNLTAVSSPAFAADRGYTGDETAAYLDTGFNPTTAASPKFVQDSGHVSGWNRAARAAANTSMAGARSNTNTNYIDLAPRAVGDIFVGRVNSAVTALSVSNALSSGHFIANRSGAGSIEGYRNGASVGTATPASVSPPNANITLLARSQQGGSPTAFSSDQIASASLGSSLSGGDSSALYSAINTYLQAVGAA